MTHIHVKTTDNVQLKMLNEGHVIAVMVLKESTVGSILVGSLRVCFNRVPL